MLCVKKLMRIMKVVQSKKGDNQIKLKKVHKSFVFDFF